MTCSHKTRSGIAWLELLLGVAAVALLFQFFPSLLHKLIWAADVRNWSSLIWFLMNLMIVLALVGVRYGPEMQIAWEQRKQRMEVKRKQDAVVRAREEKAKKIKEEREILERIREGRSRRMY